MILLAYRWLSSGLSTIQNSWVPNLLDVWIFLGFLLVQVAHHIPCQINWPICLYVVDYRVYQLIWLVLMVVCWSNTSNGSDDTQKSYRRWNQPEQPVGSFHRAMNRTLSDDSRSKGSVSPAQSITKIDFSKLERTALLRYWRHFNLVDAIPNPSKEQLIDVVQRHFTSQQLDESQVIVGFAQAAKRLKAVCN
ncbi:hypothetical protein L1049_025114 [Liquidambar formosana]|uniref:Histone deacetylase complex subunit SAP30 Sin3 binding domain-containing protein n=1 Tax=Liquidambar formosana TaxID=63359 RepID=A0AAP0RWT5_LIQFO